MKKRGFTLIELLAVIVILAIIALIATPIILSMINNARKSAAKTSAYGYIEAIDSNNGFADAEVEGYTKIANGTHQTSAITVKMKGKAPDGGTVTITNGKVSNANICINGYTVTYNGHEAEVGSKCSSSNQQQVTYTAYAIGDSINYNPVTGELGCSSPTSTTGTKTGCMKWYVIKESGTSDSTVDVILDHNTTAKVAYETSGTYKVYAEASIKTTVDDLVTTDKWKVTPRLITADEVAAITENDGWRSSTATSSQYFFFGSNDITGYLSQTNNQKKRQQSYKWLFNNTNGCTDYGCSIADSSTSGYWTSSPVFDNSTNAWNVGRSGSLSVYNVDYAVMGVRPVITITKSSLS